jgi:hypothetical protein
MQIHGHFRLLFRCPQQTPATASRALISIKRRRNRVPRRLPGRSLIQVIVARARRRFPADARAGCAPASAAGTIATWPANGAAP